ncbi:MAG: Ig-like domain-containing protein [Gemmatimonadaceae bacterium]
MFALLFASWGCGGGDGGTGVTNPPPTPVVTTVDVTPATTSARVGDVVQLTATVKDQNGAVLTGQNVAGASSATAIATVSGTGSVATITVGVVTITATVGTKSGSATITVAPLPRLEVDAAGQTAQSIGPAGGNVNLTRGGVTYQLTVPAGALAKATTIRMTPVTANRQLPSGGSFVVGLAFEPSGATFAKPLTLRIIRSVSLPAGAVLLGYSANDTGTVTELAPSARKGDTLTLAVRHFSLAAFGQFQQSSTPQLPAQLPSGNVGAFRSQLAVLDADPNATSAQYLAVFQGWFAFVDGELRSAQQLLQFDAAAHDLVEWDTEITETDQSRVFSPSIRTLEASDRALGATHLIPVLQTSISGHNLACDANPFVESSTVMGLQDIAAQFSIASSANQLDAASVLHALCLQVRNTLANFPANPTPNQTAQLDLQYGISVNNNAALINSLFKVTLDIAGTTTDGQQVAQTDPLGHLSGSVVPTGQSALNISLFTCIHPDMGYRLDEQCITHSVTRSFGITVTGDVTLASQAGLQSFSNVAKVVGNLTISPGQNAPITSTDLRELLQLTEVTGQVTISNIPSLTKLDGLRSLSKVGKALVVLNTPLTDMSGLSALRSLGGLVLQNLPSLAAVTNLSAITGLDVTGLSLVNLPALTSIAGLSGLQTAQNLTLDNLPLLTNPAALRGVQLGVGADGFQHADSHHARRSDGTRRQWRSPDPHHRQPPAERPLGTLHRHAREHADDRESSPDGPARSRRAPAEQQHRTGERRAAEQSHAAEPPPWRCIPDRPGGEPTARHGVAARHD